MLIGIDPGVVGAWAVLGVLGTIVAVGDLPVAGEGAQRSVAAPLFAKVVRKYRPTAAIVAAIGAMPGQEISSTFKFGRACGVIQSGLGALDCPTIFVQPSVGKRHLHLGAEKEMSPQRAINTWPDKASEFFAHKNDHGRVETCLIALWGLRAHFGGGGAHVL